jgi:nitrite reductase/ring-hydroxylating ferredoxin subunit
VALHREALRPGGVSEVVVGGRAVAVACTAEGTFRAVGASCPHAGGPLAEGDVRGEILTCPYHGWRFDLRDGRCLDEPGESVPTFPVEIVGDAVCVRV